MDIGQMKNIVVLKDLPSNIVDEAIVVLKKQSVKNIQYTKTNNGEEKKQLIENGYIVKEAEMLVNNYVNEIEEKRKQKRDGNWEKKYNRQKFISFGLAFVALVEFILL